MSTLNFHHNDETRMTTCEFIDNNGRRYYGYATCAPEDADFYTHLCGEVIASKRTLDKYWRAELKVLKRELRTIMEIYNSFATGKKYEAEIGSNMFKRVNKARKDKIREIQDVVNWIATNKTDLEDYLTEKEYFYQQMRKMRATNKEN